MNLPLRPTSGAPSDWLVTAEPALSTLPPVAPLAMPKQVLTQARPGLVHAMSGWLMRVWPGLRPAG